MPHPHISPPFGGWSRRQRRGVLGRAVAAFHRMPRISRPETPAPTEYIAVPGPVPAEKIERGPRESRRRRSPLELLRSRRHGKDRILRYIILPAIAILTAVGIFLLLKS